MATKNSEYWEDRIGYKVWKQYNDIEEKNRKLLAAYKKASDEIELEIFKWEQKLKTGETLTKSEKYKLARQKELKAKIQKIVKQLGQDVKGFSEKNMKDGFTNTYKNIRLELDENDFNLPNKKLMEELMKKPWHGDNFSNRLWTNTFKLAEECNKILFNGLSQGKSIASISIAMNNAMQNGFNNAHRLVRTETMHYLNSASLEAYRDAQLNKVQFWAASDERTCKTCGVGGMHGKIYEIDKAPVLPLHPNCRCCYLPVVLEGNVKEKRIKV